MFLIGAHCKSVLGYNNCTMGSMHGGISGEGLRMLDNFRRS